VGLLFRLEDYARYRERVGEATYIDVTRRTDPARVEQVWANLRAVVDTYGAPWIVQLITKDAAGTLARGGDLLRRLQAQGTTVAAHVTVTGLGGSRWEPGAPAEPFSGVPELIELSGGPEHVRWRYDPLIPTVHSLERFQRLAERASALGLKRCTLNFIAPPGRYSRVDARLAGALPGWAEGMFGLNETWRAETAAEIVGAAREQGLEAACCAESASLPLWVPGLLPAACGDYGWFVALSGRDPGRARSPGSRKGCGCAAYFDVGLYGQWARCHRCLYCYAG
jgi:hypothetical protein